MNKILIAAAISAVFASSAFAAPVASGSVFGNVNVNNTVSGGVTVVNGGFSESQASSIQTATATIGASANQASTSISGQTVPVTTTDINATVATTSNSTAWNSSSGNGGGTATATGGEGAVAGGNASIPGAATGSGYIGAGETDHITATDNTAGYTSSVEGANFDSSQSVYSVAGSTVGVGSSVTAGGYGSDAQGVLTVSGLPSTAAALVAPTAIGVGDSVTFNATGTAAYGVNTSESANAQ